LFRWPKGKQSVPVSAGQVRPLPATNADIICFRVDDLDRRIAELAKHAPGRTSFEMIGGPHWVVKSACGCSFDDQMGLIDRKYDAFGLIVGGRANHSISLLPPQHLAGSQKP
jgi:hypothetical protein